MITEAFPLNTTRLRLLDGVLLRLARSPNVRDLVLRGGILMRHWFHPIPRPVEDLDLVATIPFVAEEATTRFLPVLSDTGVPDGVTFPGDRIRTQGIWLKSGSPGVRVFATGITEGIETDFQVDITFGPAPRPAPLFTALPTTSGEPARVWCCRPEAVAGHKLQALWFRGHLGWRAKDLYDFHLLLTRVPMVPADLRDALLAYLADVGGTCDDARTLFAPGSWWDMKLCTARWFDFVQASAGTRGTLRLADVVAEIHDHLVPILEEGMR